MSPRLLRALSLVLILPALAWGADAAKREFAQAQRAVPNLENGAGLFRKCESCHGADGNGQVNGDVPRIAGQHPRVLLKQLVDFRYGKRWDTRMEAITDLHHFESTQELADVVAFVARLERAGARGLGAGDQIDAGENLYRARCQGCHGTEAQGEDASWVPRLAGQHYEYLARQMYDAAEGRRPTMRSAHARGVAALDAGEVRAIADFLARISPPRLPSDLRP